MTEEKKVYYRYDNFSYAAPVNEFEISMGKSIPSIHISTFEVVKHTPKGVWIEIPWAKKRKFILNRSRKKYASPTKELAWESFLARKKKQLSILSYQKRHIQDIIHMIGTFKTPPNETVTEDSVSLLFSKLSN